MSFAATSFKTIDLNTDRSIVVMAFEKPDKSTDEMTMPIDMFVRAVPSMMRIAEIRKQQRNTSSTGVQETTFATARTVEARADIIAARMYLILDRGMPNEVTYAIPILSGVKLGLQMYEEAERWLNDRTSAKKQ